jgi:hypothetical protein
MVLTLLCMGGLMMLPVFVVVLLVGEGKKLSFRGRPKQRQDSSVALATLAFDEEGATKSVCGTLLSGTL